jgi:putative zinc finger/helix-turn-helix YgiT family protein
MEKYVDMKSPLTGGRVKEVTTTEVKEFRKEEFCVHVRYYICEDTGEQFTTTEQDTLQFNDLYAQYRVKHGIPFPDEIKEIRKKYQLNYSQISRILGFGTNQYAKYEAGEVPSESNGKMIAAIKDKNVLLSLLKGCKAIFQPSEFERILTSITMSEEKQDEYASLHQIIYTDNVRNIYNGYGNKSIPKLFDMVGHIVAKHGEIFPTKLNKLMFYSDFCNYRKIGQSISGLTYLAWKFGPVPNHYATIYDNIPNLGKRLIEAHEMVSTIFTYPSDCYLGELSATEKESIDYVVEKLKPLSVSDIIEKNHQENGWKDNRVSNRYIPYDEAYDLQLI